MEKIRSAQENLGVRGDASQWKVSASGGFSPWGLPGGPDEKWLYVERVATRDTTARRSTLA